MFIQIEETPNPNSLKFLPGRILTKDEIIEYENTQEAAKTSILAAQLLNMIEIERVLFGTDYISISKKSDIEWEHIKPTIIDIIISYFIQYESPFLSKEKEIEIEEFFDEKDAQIVKCIKELIDSHIRTAVTKDGGDIKFRGYRDNIVYLSMHGACSGCPSAGATLKYGVENLLKHYIPQIKYVEEIL